MEILYETAFLESAVFLYTRRAAGRVPAAQIARYHAEREMAYRILDPDARERRFHELHLEWFREWGLEDRWRRIFEEMLGDAELERLAVARPRAGVEPGVELYVGPGGGRSAVLVLAPEKLAGGEGLEAFLRHEFLHLRDMLDPAFGYEPDLLTSGVPVGLERLVRERYRLLWDLSIDGRLAAAGHPVATSREAYADALGRGFGFWPAERRAEVLNRLWGGKRPSHAELVRWANDPRGVRAEKKPAPGATCPLCGFPSFEWVPEERARALESVIRAEVSWWEAGLGLCGRCAELYEVRTRQWRWQGAA